MKSSIFNVKNQKIAKSVTLLQQSFAQQINLKYCGQICTIYDGKLISYSQLQKIINFIQSKSNKKVKNFTQIYLGSRDGLSAYAYWNKVNNKSDLIIIFKSKSGNIFGGFSPCKWQYYQGYVQDNTLSSFLFSQTHDQIYPLKEANKAQAIYSNQSYGAYFWRWQRYMY
ncbi:unnamed protein product [Paramecium sonneborni]|uniref:TLDc domain-containing protein n=1 Tax=Paramecium sonneborni TaxID=65129 RepID=A0A8S1RR06_9CILI|nr:unnamed protein product [Paramecium sonneborni]